MDECYTSITYFLIFSFHVILLYLPNFIIAVPILRLDDSVYTTFDNMIITLTDSILNTNSEIIESIQVIVSNSVTSEKVTLHETDTNTGIFQKDIRLTPDPSRYVGDIQVRRDDSIIVSYNVDAENLITETALIKYHEAVVSFDSTSYKFTYTSKI
ncbi:MAG: hypothetical protein CMO16_00480 [Thaumarchaeota archaeon]|nr:hypothetical protein [Nitrososphaerota archaeon]